MSWPSTVKQNISVTMEADKSCRKCFSQSQSHPEEECVCTLNFTSLQATPHPRAGQPAQKTEKQPFEPLGLLIGFRELCSTTRLNQNPETVLHYSTSKCPTRPQKIVDSLFISTDQQQIMSTSAKSLGDIYSSSVSVSVRTFLTHLIFLWQ